MAMITASAKQTKALQETATTTVKNDAYNNVKMATINHGEGNGNEATINTAMCSIFGVSNCKTNNAYKHKISRWRWWQLAGVGYNNSKANGAYKHEK